MSTTQKLELSREIRQWIGMGIGATTTGLFILMMLFPETFDKITNKIRKRLNQ